MTKTQKIFIGAIALMACAASMYLALPAKAPQFEDVSKAPELQLPDGGVRIERDPTVASEVTPIMPGAKVVRSTRVTVQPKPVEVEMQLVETDAGYRVDTRTNGQIIAGLDVPVRVLKLPDDKKWAAGVSCDPTRCSKTAGVWIDRDLGNFRVGAELHRDAQGGPAIRAKLGYIW